MTPFKCLYGFLLVGLLAVGCEKDNKVTPTEDNQPVTVKVNQLARVKQDVTLNVDNIADSRCPMNANCIWLGNATVKFSLKNDTQTQTGELCIGQCGPHIAEEYLELFRAARGGGSFPEPVRDRVGSQQFVNRLFPALVPHFLKPAVN